MTVMLRAKNKAKTNLLLAIMLDYLHSKQRIFKSKHQKRLKILFDTWCGAALIYHSLVKWLKQKTDKLFNFCKKTDSFTAISSCMDKSKIVSTLASRLWCSLKKLLTPSYIFKQNCNAPVHPTWHSMTVEFRAHQGQQRK